MCFAFSSQASLSSASSSSRSCSSSSRSSAVSSTRSCAVRRRWAARELVARREEAPFAAVVIERVLRLPPKKAPIEVVLAQLSDRLPEPIAGQLEGLLDGEGGGGPDLGGALGGIRKRLGL